MIWYVIGGIVLLFLIFKFRKSSAVPILLVDIKCDSGLNLAVSFEKLDSQITSVEYARLIIHFIIKAHYLCKTTKNVDKSRIEGLVNTLSNYSNINDGIRALNAEISINKGINIGNSKEIVAKLMFVDTVGRHIDTKIPFTPYDKQYYYSVIGLIYSSIPHLDNYSLGLLQRSMKHMNDEFSNPNRISSITTTFSLPNRIYTLSILGDKIPSSF